MASEGENELTLTASRSVSEIEEDYHVSNNHSFTCKQLPCYVVFASIVAAIGGIMFGYDLGIIAGAMILLKTEASFNLTCVNQELVVGSMMIGGVVGSAVGGVMIDKFGRKTMIIVNGLVFVAAGLVLSTSNSFAVLITGRVLVGVAISVSAMVDCIYISEISPPNRRGMLVSLNELAITMGMLIAYLVNYLFINVHDGWRYMFGLSVIPCLIQISIMLFLPETPRQHILKGRISQAQAVLQKFRPSTDISIELEDIKKSIASEKEHTVCELFSSKDNLRGRLGIAAGLVFLMQMTGEPNILMYAPTLFGSFGFTSRSAQTLATVGLGVTKLVATFVSVLLLDRAGRRVMLIIGASLMAVSTACIAGLTWVNSGDEDTLVCVDNTTAMANISALYDDTQLSLSKTSTSTQAKQYLSLISLMVYVMSYSIGFATGSWLIMAEIFPSSIRGQAMSVAMVISGLTSALVSLTFVSLINAIHVYWTFTMYAIICLLSVFYIFIFVPETKNRSLEQIAVELSRDRRSGSNHITRPLFSPRRYTLVHQAEDLHSS